MSEALPQRVLLKQRPIFHNFYLNWNLDSTLVYVQQIKGAEFYQIKKNEFYQLRGIWQFRLGEYEIYSLFFSEASLKLINDDMRSEMGSSNSFLII